MLLNYSSSGSNYIEKPYRKVLAVVKVPEPQVDEQEGFESLLISIALLSKNPFNCFHLVHKKRQQQLEKDVMSVPRFTTSDIMVS